MKTFIKTALNGTPCYIFFHRYLSNFSKLSPKNHIYKLPHIHGFSIILQIWAMGTLSERCWLMFSSLNQKQCKRVLGCYKYVRNRDSHAGFYDRKNNNTTIVIVKICCKLCRLYITVGWWRGCYDRRPIIVRLMIKCFIASTPRNKWKFKPGQSFHPMSGGRQMRQLTSQTTAMAIPTNPPVLLRACSIGSWSA